MKTNKKPDIIPEIRDWLGGAGTVSLAASCKIIIDASDFNGVKKIFEVFVSDLKNILGFAPAIKGGVTRDVLAGDILVRMSDCQDLKAEGYNINISDTVEIKASTKTGLVWATKTLLQLFMLSNDKSLPKGIIDDAPRFRVRGFMLDVGRKPFDLSYLYDVVKTMSFYKMNDFHVHLNDNYIWIETLEDPTTAYSGFRLESNIKGLTSSDTFYTKDEFREFVKTSKEIYGVNIIPEIDVPAHSLALTNARPDLRLGLKNRDAEHLDLSNPDTLPFVQGVFSEYTDGDDPVFAGNVVHIGTDEYNKDYAEVFRQFSADMISFLQSKGRTARLWGSLTALKGKTPITGKGAQTNIWSNGWGRADEMYALGFDLINTLDGHLYIVPGANYYNDWLNKKYLYKKWKPNVIGKSKFKTDDPQMLGAAFCIWNDLIYKKDNGLTEHGILARAYDAMPALSEKLWGEGKDKSYKEFLSVMQELQKHIR